MSQCDDVMSLTKNLRERSLQRKFNKGNKRPCIHHATTSASLPDCPQCRES